MRGRGRPRERNIQQKSRKRTQAVSRSVRRSQRSCTPNKKFISEADNGQATSQPRSKPRSRSRGVLEVVVPVATPTRAEAATSRYSEDRDSEDVDEDDTVEDVDDESEVNDWHEQEMLGDFPAQELDVEMPSNTIPSTDEIAAAVIKQLKQHKENPMQDLQTASPIPSNSTEPMTTGTPNTGLDSIIGQLLADTDHDNDVNVPLNTLNASGAPLGANLKETTKQKIWDGQFVDFGALLNPSDNQKFHLSIDHFQGNPKLSVEPSVRPKPIYTIEQWTNAFIIYAAVYAEKIPTETPQLLKYASIVRDLANKASFGWKTYDNNFRKLKQQFPAMTWDYFHTELWARAMSMNLQRTQNQMPSGQRHGQPFLDSSAQQYFSPGFRPRQRPLRTAGSCWSYDKTGYCQKPQCQFTHKCYLCGGSHPAVRCQTGPNYNPRPPMAAPQPFYTPRPRHPPNFQPRMPAPYPR